MSFAFCFLRAGGADGAIARRWSVAKRRATPGNGEEENQALEGRQIMQIKGCCSVAPAGVSHIIALQSWSAASQRFTPGYCSGGAFGAKRLMALAETAAVPGAIPFGALRAFDPTYVKESGREAGGRQNYTKED
jgi:hypothetical protein